MYPADLAATELFRVHFGSTNYPTIVSVPGRVNLIGEHIDYHDLPVLPMAIQRRISIAYQVRTDANVRAVSEGYGSRLLNLEEQIPAFFPGDWGNYLLAAVRMIQARWQVSLKGIDAAISSDLPPAAGLSSSSALLSGFAIALLQANGIRPTISEWLDILPEGEQFVGTRGGGMDHAAVLGSQAGCALSIQFAPLRLKALPIPADWAFLVAHSLTSAEKAGAAKVEYNARRTAANRALDKLGFARFHDASLNVELSGLSPDERGAYIHCVGEAERVDLAVNALQADDIRTFGALLSASHASLRDDLQVSNWALDELVACAEAAGSLGARLTGAGFGGCAIILSKVADRERIRRALIESFYAKRPGFDPANHLLFAEPSAGALLA